MKHEAINVDDPGAFRDSILDVMQWTQETIHAELLRVITLCAIDEDAGCRVRLPTASYRTQDSVVAWFEIPITATAESEYRTRIIAAKLIWREKFHVEHTTRPGDRDHIMVHRILIRYVFG